MSVIQKIRDKYARWAVIAIAVSLLGFILMDAFAGKTGLFNNGQSNTLGKVNGTAIDRLDFDKKIKAQEAQYASQNYQLTDEQRQQMSQQLWEQEVNDIVMNKEYEKLGLTVTDKELQDMLYGANAPQELKQKFTDPKTNRFDANAARQEINRELKDPVRKQDLQKYFDYLKNQRLLAKYMALIANTIYFPKWFLEKRNVDNSLLGKISYISVPYTTIPDSTIKISDDEIQSFINSHKDQFEQKEESRAIQYILFSATPSASDSVAARAALLHLKAGFDTTSAANIKQFVEANNSTLPFFDGYLGKKTIQVPLKDSILALPKGAVYGPYLDAGAQNHNGVFALAKMIDSKVLPDSVKCRHILIGTVDRQGQPLMPDSLAKVKADSIALAIRNGASFDLLDSLYSTDEVAKKDKGVMTFTSQQIQNEGFAKEFGKFILFDGKPGDKKVVKTQFGWHYIEIMEQKSFEPHYKIAYLANDIMASPETDQQAHNQANLFAGDSRDLNSFNSNYDKNLRSKGIPKLVANDIAPMAYNIDGLPGPSRPFIRKVFDADKGDVIGPERVGENYVVAIVTEVNKPGLRSVSSARSSIEPMLKNKKKGEEIAKKIGQVTTLEAAAAKMNQNIQTIDSLRFSGGRQLGYEPKILGAAFNPANKGKVVPEPLTGTSGVFVVRVDNVTTTPVQAANIEDQRKMMEMQAKQGLLGQMQQQQGYNPITDVLKKAANIQDNRAKFY